MVIEILLTIIAAFAWYMIVQQIATIRMWTATQKRLLYWGGIGMLVELVLVMTRL